VPGRVSSVPATRRTRRPGRSATSVPARRSRRAGRRTRRVAPFVVRAPRLAALRAAATRSASHRGLALPGQARWAWAERGRQRRGRRAQPDEVRRASRGPARWASSDEVRRASPPVSRSSEQVRTASRPEQPRQRLRPGRPSSGGPASVGPDGRRDWQTQGQSQVPHSRRSLRQLLQRPRSARARWVGSERVRPGRALPAAPRASGPGHPEDRPRERWSTWSGRQPSGRPADAIRVPAGRRSRSRNARRIGRSRRAAFRIGGRNALRRSSGGLGSRAGSAYGHRPRTAHPTRAAKERPVRRSP
jgi:hypothetical protein